MHYYARHQPLTDRGFFEAFNRSDGSRFTFAALWENWKDPQTDEWIRACTIVGGEPNELVAQIHLRIPAICVRLLIHDQRQLAFGRTLALSVRQLRSAAELRDMIDGKVAGPRKMEQSYSRAHDCQAKRVKIDEARSK
jgi:hypothetical protein